MKRPPRFAAAGLLLVLLLASWARADAYDPPAGYYSTATGAGTTLKQQLNTITKTGHTPVSYDSLRSALQVTDADPNNPGHMLLVYDRVSLNVAAINGSIPGWDLGKSWDREHTWPQSRGLDGTSMPDGSDMHALRPSTPSVNNSRGNSNFGGAYGAQSFGYVTDNGNSVFYPGDADAGMVARHSFYMSVRYDGTDAKTTDLEAVAGNPVNNGSVMGDLGRMIEWHFAAPPDEFERRRNQVIYADYQHNRNPFIDRPEYAWSVFVDQMNDSQISIDGGTINGFGSSTRSVDLGRVYVGRAVPSAQMFTLNKGGDDGTYFEVTTAGDATSSLSGRYNAFRTAGTDSRSITIGLDTSTATAGMRSGTVTIDNLDVTTGAGLGHGGNDGTDRFNVSLAVVNHPIASLSHNVEQREHTIDFGIVPLSSGLQAWASSIMNLAAFGAPEFAANLDLDGYTGAGDTDLLQLDLSPFSGLEQGETFTFDSLFFPDAVGQFAATYTLNLSDEDLPGEQTQTLSLTLLGQALLAGDYNRDGAVNAADYLQWRKAFGQNVTAYSGADGNGDGMVDIADHGVWMQNFGQLDPGAGAGGLAAVVPEPGSLSLLVAGVGLAIGVMARRPSAGRRFR